MYDEEEDFKSLLDTIKFSNISDDSATDRDGLPEETLKAEWDNEVHVMLKRRYNNDTTARMWLAGSTQAIICLWMACVVVILMMNNCHFQLSSGVLITILGTTTATVIGLAYIVLKGFFSVMKQDVDLRDHQLKK